MTSKVTPTDEGRRRYPKLDGYFFNDVPCTCTPLCDRRCAGECGCDACRLQFTVFCDEMGFMGFEPPTDAERAEHLAIYRSPMPDEFVELMRSTGTLDRYPKE